MAVIISSVALALALAVLDVTYKQVLLSSTERQSSVAFYNADAALECALYYDQKQDSFDFANAPTSFSITCNTQSITVSEPITAGSRTATFSLPWGAGTSGAVTVIKSSTGATKLYASGYSSADSSDLRRIERGLRASY